MVADYECPNTPELSDNDWDRDDEIERLGLKFHWQRYVARRLNNTIDRLSKRLRNLGLIFRSRTAEQWQALGQEHQNQQANLHAHWMSGNQDPELTEYLEKQARIAWNNFQPYHERQTTKQSLDGKLFQRRTRELRMREITRCINKKWGLPMQDWNTKIYHYHFQVRPPGGNGQPEQQAEEFKVESIES
ncbi:uncharacterized protein BKA78DRAFT_299698 [Phyllosticta capitalensis]|uniref:uncharacterized protein n=1 Tax=Phyllosticta capitalensis TaxID=121624 RepID=UPI00312DE129